MPKSRYLICHLSKPEEDLNVYSRFIKTTIIISNIKIWKYLAMGPILIIRRPSIVMVCSIEIIKTSSTPGKM
jgi:hypothetical protein